MLKEIIIQKRKEIERKKIERPSKLLDKSIYFDSEVFSLKESILNPERSGIIAEFKRKSPSKGDINIDADILKVVTGYQEAKASGISILTDYLFFGGNNADMIKVRPVMEIPLLRKDFIIDEYQIIEAKANGADAILLIAAILEKDEIWLMTNFAKSIGLEVLLEIHDKDEVEKINNNVDLIGVNNRNLKDFTVDIQSSIELYEYLPKEIVKISESGISSPENIKKLKEVGYDGFLVGTNFMKTEAPEKAFEEFVKQLK